MTKMLTGQVILREHGEAPTRDGRKLFSIVGLVAVPDGFEFKGEHQYVITGDASGALLMHSSTEIDVTEEAKGQQIGSLLKSPIWRC